VGFGEPNAQLSGRQQQVFRLLGDGVAALDIAERMGISLKTVHTHIERLKHRMNCPNKAVLCHLAAIESAREGFSPPTNC
jgi:DNA-binding CsgD family transcriptional regulator